MTGNLFHFPIPQRPETYANELVVDFFCGGGGASSGIEAALGRPVDHAINHDDIALTMHAANHPFTEHHAEDVFAVDPRTLTQGRPVGLFWGSPDCTHHSRARGGTPVRKEIRGLAWVIVKWAGTVKPRIIMLENVPEFLDWGPLVAMRDAAGRVVYKDGRMCMRADKKRRGKTFKRFVNELRRHGYAVEWRKLRACDYGAPTTRERLFLVARRDGQPITWPDATHGPRAAQPYRTAAECIDWTIPTPSIFTRKRPLATATLRRVARGLAKFVVSSPKPYIVAIDHQSNGDSATSSADAPLSTITTKARHIVANPYLAAVGGRAGNNPPRDANDPLWTTTTKADTAVVNPYLVQVNHEGGDRAQPLEQPLPTLTAKNGQALSVAHVTKFQQQSIGQEPDVPLDTIMAGATRFGVVAASISTFYGEKPESDTVRGSSLEEPIATQTTENRFGLVAASLVQTGYGEREGQEPRALDIERPLGTVVAGGGKHALVAASLVTNTTGHAPSSLESPVPTITTGDQQMLAAASIVKHYGGSYRGAGSSLEDPLHTITAFDHNALMTAHIARQFGTSIGHAADEPLKTVMAGGGGGKSQLVTGFVDKYYGTGSATNTERPLPSITTHDRFSQVQAALEGRPNHADAVYALLLEHAPQCLSELDHASRTVGVVLNGERWTISDVGMRMLQPLELYRAQGFDGRYDIAPEYRGKPLTKERQVRLVGNSVPPPVSEALVRANYTPVTTPSSLEMAAD
jgi:DNA (cytosine-5)-methyltransferase 1